MPPQKRKTPANKSKVVGNGKTGGDFKRLKGKVGKRAPVRNQVTFSEVKGKRVVVSSQGGINAGNGNDDGGNDESKWGSADGNGSSDSDSDGEGIDPNEYEGDPRLLTTDSNKTSSSSPKLKQTKLPPNQIIEPTLIPLQSIQSQSTLKTFPTILSLSTSTTSSISTRSNSLNMLTALLQTRPTQKVGGGGGEYNLCSIRYSVFNLATSQVLQAVQESLVSEEVKLLKEAKLLLSACLLPPPCNASSSSNSNSNGSNERLVTIVDSLPPHLPLLLTYLLSSLNSLSHDTRTTAYEVLSLLFTHVPKSIILAGLRKVNLMQTQTQAVDNSRSGSSGGGDSSKNQGTGGIGSLLKCFEKGVNNRRVRKNLSSVTSSEASKATGGVGGGGGKSGKSGVGETPLVQSYFLALRGVVCVLRALDDAADDHDHDHDHGGDSDSGSDSSSASLVSVFDSLAKTTTCTTAKNFIQNDPNLITFTISSRVALLTNLLNNYLECLGSILPQPTATFSTTAQSKSKSAVLDMDIGGNGTGNGTLLPSSNTNVLFGGASGSIEEVTLLLTGLHGLVRSSFIFDNALTESGRVFNPTPTRGDEESEQEREQVVMFRGLQSVGNLIIRSLPFMDRSGRSGCSGGGGNRSAGNGKISKISYGDSDSDRTRTNGVIASLNSAAYNLLLQIHTALGVCDLDITRSKALSNTIKKEVVKLRESIVGVVVGGLEVEIEGINNLNHPNNLNSNFSRTSAIQTNNENSDEEEEEEEEGKTKIKIPSQTLTLLKNLQKTLPHAKWFDLITKFIAPSTSASSGGGNGNENGLLMTPQVINLCLLVIQSGRGVFDVDDDCLDVRLRLLGVCFTELLPFSSDGGGDNELGEGAHHHWKTETLDIIAELLRTTPIEEEDEDKNENDAHVKLMNPLLTSFVTSIMSQLSIIFKPTSFLYTPSHHSLIPKLLNTLTLSPKSPSDDLVKSFSTILSNANVNVKLTHTLPNNIKNQIKSTINTLRNRIPLSTYLTHILQSLPPSSQYSFSNVNDFDFYTRSLTADILGLGFGSRVLGPLGGYVEGLFDPKVKVKKSKLMKKNVKVVDVKESKILSVRRGLTILNEIGINELERCSLSGPTSTSASTSTSSSTSSSTKSEIFATFKQSTINAVLFMLQNPPSAMGKSSGGGYDVEKHCGVISRYFWWDFEVFYQVFDSIRSMAVGSTDTDTGIGVEGSDSDSSSEIDLTTVLSTLLITLKVVLKSDSNSYLFQDDVTEKLKELESILCNEGKGGLSEAGKVRFSAGLGEIIGRR